MSRKEFKSFDEQIQLLEQRNLHIENKKRLKWYLKNFNYHNFINAYNDFFMFNEDRKTDKYKDIINSDMLITCFNLDRKISSDFLPYILTIERKLSTLITYHILNEYKKKMNHLLFGEILKLKNEEILEIFPGIKKYNFEKNEWIKDNNKNKTDIEKNIKSFKKLISQDSSYKDICKIYKNENEFPIWALSINWSMGLSIKIYSFLNIGLQNIIVKQFCTKLYKNIHIHFHKVLILINSVRNKICHNNVLFKIDYVKSNKEIKFFLDKKGYKSKNNNIRLSEIIFLIDLLKPMKTITLKNKIKTELKLISIDSKNIEFIENDTFSKIKKHMNLK